MLGRTTFKLNLIRDTDSFSSLHQVSNKKEDLESLEKLSKLINKVFPKSMLSAYYDGMYNEKQGNLKRALQRYKSGLLLEPSQSVDKEMILDKMYETQDKMKE